MSNKNDFEMEELDSPHEAGEHPSHHAHGVNDLDFAGLPSFDEDEREPGHHQSHEGNDGTEGLTHGDPDENWEAEPAAATKKAKAKTSNRTILLGAAAAVAIGAVALVALPHLNHHNSNVPVASPHFATGPQVTPNFNGVRNGPNGLNPSLPGGVAQRTTGVLPSSLHAAPSPATMPIPVEVASNPSAAATHDGDAPSDAQPAPVQTPQLPGASHDSAPAAGPSTDDKLASVLGQLTTTIKNMNDDIKGTRDAVESSKSELLRRLQQTGDHVQDVSNNETALGKRVDAIEQRLHIAERSPAAGAQTDKPAATVAVHPKAASWHRHRAHHPVVAADADAPKSGDISAYKLKGVSRTHAVVEGPNGFISLTLGEEAKDASGRPIAAIGKVKSLTPAGDGWVLQTDGGDIR